MKKAKKFLSLALTMVMSMTVLGAFQPIVQASVLPWTDSLGYQKPVTSSGAITSGSNPSSREGLVDGITGTTAGTHFRQNLDAYNAEGWAWARVDLGDVLEVSMFQIRFGRQNTSQPTSNARGIRIEGSINGVEYFEIIPTTSHENGLFPHLTDFVFDAEQRVAARFIRLNYKYDIEKLYEGTTSIIFIQEFAIYNPGVSNISWADSLAHQKTVTSAGDIYGGAKREGLVDGNPGYEDFSYFRPHSTSFNANGWTWVQVDLETVKSVNFFKLLTNRMNTSQATSNIAKLRIEGSIDGTNFTDIIGDTSYSSGGLFPYSTYLTFASAQNAKARYIRLWLKYDIENLYEGTTATIIITEFGVYNREPNMDLSPITFNKHLGDNQFEEIFNIEEGTIRVSMEIDVLVDIPRNVTLFAVLYNCDIKEMKNIKIESFDLSHTETNNIFVDIEVDSDIDYTLLKAFVWDSTNGLTPLADYAYIN